MNIDIYPNPSNGKFTINSNKIRQIEIIDAMGKTILMSDLLCQTLNINLCNKPKGIYFIRILTKENITTKKITVK